MTIKNKTVIRHIQGDRTMAKAFTEREREIIVETMIKVGAELIRKKGLRQVTVEEITKGADIAKGSFYSFYDSREELFWEIIKHEERELLKRIEIVASESIDRREKIVKIFNEIFLGEDCLVFYLPSEDMNYVARKMPLEIIEADKKEGKSVIKTLLNVVGLCDNQSSIELLMSMIHTLQFVASDEKLTNSTRKRMFEIMVEAFADSLKKGENK